MRLSKLLVCGLLVCALSACTSAKKSDDNSPETNELDASNGPPATDTDSLPPEERDALDTKVASNDAVPAAPTEAAPEPEKKAKGKHKKQAVQAQNVSDTGMGEYTVQKGDTLMKIAFEKYGDLYQWKKIVELNKEVINGVGQLAAGTVLKIDGSGIQEVDRNGDKYLIKIGDTLGTISGEVYGSQGKWKKLWENNKTLIKDPNRIYAGFYLYYLMTQQDVAELEQFKKEAGNTRVPASN